jgi:signal transduction histidine kinase
MAVLGLRRAGPDARITLAAGLWIVAGVVCTSVWVLVGAEGRWPAWVWVATGAPVAVAVALRAAWRVHPGPARWAAVHAGLAVVAAGLLALVWVLTGRGEWLPWPLLGIGTAFTVHALLAFADRLPPRPRERALTERVSQLERTRRGALDVQAAELRRLERDLHDGAQSRLVALGMLLGRAEARLEDDPAAAELVRRARAEATAAIAELRDLARGLAPPLLAERGLEAAVRGLARRTPARTTVDARLRERPSPEAEAAVYFVVAEALTNVLKHAPGAAVRIGLAAIDDRVVATVADDGPGGADPAGTGLLGLRRRVEALDGRLDVQDAGGTTIRAEVPAGW